MGALRRVCDVKSTYNKRLAQAQRLPLGSGRPLQALLRGSGATRNGKSQHYEVDMVA